MEPAGCLGLLSVTGGEPRANLIRWSPVDQMDRGNIRQVGGRGIPATAMRAGAVAGAGVETGPSAREFAYVHIH